MDDFPKSSSFKTTVAKFKQFAKECTDEAIKATSGGKSSRIKSNIKINRIQIIENNTHTDSIEEKCQDEENDAPSNQAGSLSSAIKVKSTEALQKLQDATHALEEMSAGAAKDAQDALSKSATQIIQVSDDLATSIKEKATTIAATAKEKVEDVNSSVKNMAEEAKTTLKEAASTAQEKIEKAVKSTSEHAILMATSALEQTESISDMIIESIRNKAETVKVGSDLDEHAPNDSLMCMLEKSDVSCTVIGDPSEDFAEACKIICEFDEESSVAVKKCEYACLAVNKLRDEVLKTAKDISNKGEHEKSEQRNINS